MEFEITKKAKRNTLLIAGGGLLLTLIGIITNFNDHHFMTRFMASGLINAFYFFAIGLGALFFLALAYAT